MLLFFFWKSHSIYRELQTVSKMVKSIIDLENDRNPIKWVLTHFIALLWYKHAEMGLINIKTITRTTKTNAIQIYPFHKQSLACLRRFRICPVGTTVWLSVSSVVRADLCNFRFIDFFSYLENVVRKKYFLFLFFFFFHLC